MHYARTVNDEVKYEHPGANSYEIKAIIGQRWRALPESSAGTAGRYFPTRPTPARAASPLLPPPLHPAPRALVVPLSGLRSQ